MHYSTGLQNNFFFKLKDINKPYTIIIIQILKVEVMDIITIIVRILDVKSYCAYLYKEVSLYLFKFIPKKDRQLLS